MLEVHQSKMAYLLNINEISSGDQVYRFAVPFSHASPYQHKLNDTEKLGRAVSMTLESGNLKSAYHSNKAQQVVFIKGVSVHRVASGNVYTHSGRHQRESQANDIHNHQLPAPVGRGDSGIGRCVS
jgi:hypothetical protein